MNKSNQNVSFKGAKLQLTGRELKIGDTAPGFKLVGVDMSDIESSKYSGKVLVLSTVPSLDTPTCAVQTKRFNDEAAKLGAQVAILTVSMDLPFAQKRWCGAEGVERVETGSDYKYHEFGESYGVLIREWGLLARAVFVVDRSGKIVHVDYVSEVSEEPDYASALAAVSAA